MNRPELIQECSRRFGKRAWLGAGNDELQRCIDTGSVPEAWASGRASASAASMAGSTPADASDAPSKLPAPEPSRTSNNGRSDALADAIAQALQGRITAGIDEAAVEQICRR